MTKLSTFFLIGAFSKTTMTVRAKNMFCTRDLFTCPDGTYVSRNPANDCEFDPCLSYPVSRFKTRLNSFKTKLNEHLAKRVNHAPALPVLHDQPLMPAQGDDENQLEI